MASSRGHEVVTVEVPLDLLHGAAGVMCDHLGQTSGDGEHLTQLDLHVAGAPRVPADPWWIMIFALGRASRFPCAPPHRTIAAADMPMPTHTVETSGRMCWMTS